MATQRRKDEDNEAIKNAIKNASNNKALSVNAQNNLNQIVKDKKKGIEVVTKDYTGRDTVDKINPSNVIADTMPTREIEPASQLAYDILYGSYKSDSTKALENQANAYASNKPYWDDKAMSADMMSAYNDYANREKFAYDINADALYNQYKNQYMAQGKLAMQDAIGQASAATGGYGNSYAQSVGQQTYQGYTDKINDAVPELYQLAYSQYQDEGNALLDKYNLAKDRYDNQYNLYLDKLDQYNTEQSRLDELAQEAIDSDYNLALEKYNASLGTSSSSSDSSSESAGLSYSDMIKITTDLDKLDNLDKIASRLDTYVTSGYITESEADSIYNQYVNDSKFAAPEATADNTALVDRDWKMTYHGGNNWFGGIDENGEVEDQFGNVYTLKDLYKELKNNGMTARAAKQWVIDLQKRVGITKK